MKTIKTPAGKPDTGSEDCSFRISSQKDFEDNTRANDMSKTLFQTQDTGDIALFTDLNARFFEAVHRQPVLFHDVIRTGMAMRGLNKDSFFTEYDEKIAYEIVLLHSGNVNNDSLAKMFMLQDQVAVINAPHPDNVIDYKDENEIIDHYANGGLGLGIFAVDGSLIGQAILGFHNSNAQIGWVMVDKNYGGNKLCDQLIDIADQMAYSSKMNTLKAKVRVSNQKGIEKFSRLGFTVTGIDHNKKDGAKTLTLTKKAGQDAEPVCEHMGTRPISLNSLKDSDKSDYLERMIEEGFTVKWDSRARWFTFCEPSVITPVLKPVK